MKFYNCSNTTLETELSIDKDSHDWCILYLFASYGINETRF